MSLDLFTAFNSEDLWLKFSDKEYDIAMEKAKNFASLAQQHQALINFLASNCLIKWLNMTYGDLIRQVNFEFEEKDLFSIWQFVNGTPLIINNLSRRLVVIPEECEDLSEFNIPQEWLDIPQLRGDYFFTSTS